MKSLAASLVVLLSCLLSPGFAAAQSATGGSVRGYVTDEQKAALPGVTVTAASPTVARTFTAVTDGEGLYRLVDLPPGDYSLTAELAGFAKTVREPIVVRAALNLSVDVAMQVGGLSETIEVRRDTPMLEVDKPVQAVNISGALQRQLPLSPRRDYTDFLEATPGLNTYVNPQSGGGIYSLRGSTIESHVVQMDGADMSSFRQSRPDYIAISSDALEDVQVKVAASDASAPLGNGVVINVATPSGTNAFKGSLSTAYTSKDWSADNNPTGDPNFSTLKQADASLGGPIRPDGWWFFGSWRKVSRELGINRDQSQLDLAAALIPGWTSPNNTFEGDSLFGKVNGKISPLHLVEGFYQWDKYPTTANEATDTGSWRVQSYGGLGYSARLSSVWNDHFSTKVSVSFNNKSLNSNRSDYDGYIGTGPSRPVHSSIFQSAGVATGSGVLVRLDNIESGSVSPAQKATIAVDATYYKTGWFGSHELQVGTLLQPSMTGTSTTLYANGGNALEEVVLVNGNLVPFHRRVYDRDELMTGSFKSTDSAVYVQDGWKPTSRLTLNMGVRLDFVTGHDRILDRQTQDSLEVGPRFGGTYVLTEDRFNVLRASWGRIAELVSSFSAPTLSSSNAGYTDTYDNNLDGVFETVRTTPGATTARLDRVVDEDLHQPYVDEWTVGYRRQLPGQLSIDGGFVQRSYKDRPALVDVNGIYDGNVFKGYRDESLNDIFLITNNGWNWFDYKSLEFMVTKRTARVQFIGSYVRAWRHIGGTWQPNDPASFIQPDAFANDKGLGIPRGNVTNSLSGTADTFGNTGWQDHTGRLAITWTAPWNLIVAGSYTVQSGSFTGPIVTRIGAADPQFGPTSVTLSNGRVVSNPLSTTIRFAFPTRGDGQVKAAARNEVNVRLGRKFKFGGNRSLDASLDIFNLTNAGSPERYRSDANQQYNPFYLGAQNLQPPRVAQIAARFTF
jgi:hypothetical protein